MSKFFFKGRIDPRENYENFGYKTKRVSKGGSEKYPLQLLVASIERKQEVEALLESKGLFAQIKVDAEQPENIAELEAIINKAETKIEDKKPGRNEVCICGSGKKYKHCCA